MDNTNQGQSSLPQTVPDILTRENQEKFRRKWIIISRILSLFLILALVYWGYIYSTSAKNIIPNACWQCGYYEGMKCEQQYLPPGGTGSAIVNKDTIHQWLLDIANYNINQSKSKDLLRKDNIPLNFNLTIISNVMNNTSG